MPNSSNLPDASIKQPQLQKAFRDQLPPLLLLTSIFFVNFLARIVLAPLMPAIESDLGFRIGFIGDISSFGPGIALVGGLILAGTIFSGYLKFYN